VVLMRWWWWWGIAFANARRERGLRAKNPKSSHWGSISGAPSEIGMESGEGRWCGGADEAVVVVGRCVRKREAGEGVWAKSQNLAVVAQFRVHRAKQRRGMVGRGGVVVCMRWQWWWGCALAKREAGRGVWAKIIMII
jgi:hypothetical protein